MKQLILITGLCLLAGISGATFEIEDPSQPEKNAKSGTPMEAMASEGLAEEKVIVPVGTELFVPDIMQGHCTNWRFDESEPAVSGNDEMQFTTRTTYIGVTIKTINCQNESEAEARRFALVQIERGRLIWVELNRILSAN